VTLALKAAGAVFSVPYDNMVTAAEYTRQLQGAGFADVKLEDVSADVFSGVHTAYTASSLFVQAPFGVQQPNVCNIAQGSRRSSRRTRPGLVRLRRPWCGCHSAWLRT
jgi:hypothetical protein